MHWKFNIGALICIVASLIQIKTAAAERITGDWLHSTKPAVIHINLSTGIASIKSHKLHPQAEGLTLIKDLAQQPSNDHQWDGNMFNGYAGHYQRVTLRLLQAKELAVYNAENEEILRLNRE